MSIEPYETDRVETLNDPSAFRYCSGEELRTFLDADPGGRVAEFGSGTGLFTSELAPVAETVFAVDIRRQLHDVYRESGIPENVVPILADFARLPCPNDFLDGGVSLRTYHHGFDDVLDEVARVIRPGGRLVVVDWSVTGGGERAGRDDEEYFDVATVQSQLLAHGFRIAEAHERYETFVVVGVRR